MKLEEVLYELRGYFSDREAFADTIGFQFETDSEFYRFYETFIRDLQPPLLTATAMPKVVTEDGHATFRFEMLGFKIVAVSKQKRVDHGHYRRHVWGLGE